MLSNSIKSVRILQVSDIEESLKILHQDTLQYCDGTYPEEKWVGTFISDPSCLAYGVVDTDGWLFGIALGEKLRCNGFLLWYLAVRPECQGKGYGSVLLKEFERIAHDKGVEWIYITSTANSVKFWKQHGYDASNTHKVVELAKDLGEAPINL